MKYFAAFLPILALASAQPIAKRHQGVKIQSTANGRCLSPKAPNTESSLVVAIDCDGAQAWDINPGSGSVILSGTDLALDAGSGNEDNEDLTVQKSTPGAFQQTWYLTDDGRMAITNGVQCLDQGNDTEGTQTYRCYPGNTNQEWHILNADGSVAASASNNEQ
ncbi:hypothetical protein I317_02714 [Kwoniella heveanensis CBS 569]|nr:hypothetical protein I317_02714 [Kwoniella heveanensis CBS 569]